MNFKEENIKKHSELFCVTDEVHALADELMYAFNCKSNTEDFRPSQMPLHKTVFLYLFNAALKQYASIKVLCLEGYGQSSSIILRSMLENLISIKYMIFSENTSSLAERFIGYRWIDMRKSLNYWRMEDKVKNKDLRDKILLKEKEIEQKCKDFKERFNIKKGQLKTWSGLSIEEMAQKADMLADYNLMYRLSCNFSHSGFLGAQPGVDKGLNHTLFSSKPAFDFIIGVLESAIQYLHEFLSTYNHMFKLEKERELSDFHKKAIKVFGMSKYKENDG